jgi:hypothetical protein
VLQTFEKLPSKNLQGFIVWVPILRNDTSAAALEQISAEPADSRLIDGWDSDKSIGNAFRQTLGLRRTAWDVYMIYDSDVQWTDEKPPPPSFWMHQLSGNSGADPKLALQDEEFLNATAHQLQALEQR